MGKRRAHGRVCMIEGCDRPDNDLGLCTMHGSRFRQGKRLDLGRGQLGPVRVMVRRPSIDRFLDRVVKNGPPPPDHPEMGPCWLWTGSLQANGYTSFNADGIRTAHRWSYRRYVGPIPEGYHVHHRCHVPRCVNPAHLEVLPAGMHFRLRRAPKPPPRCPRGHEFTPENTYRNPQGHRACRTCQRAKARAHKAALRAARPPKPIPTHCKNGHEFTRENSYVRPAGTRECRVCRRIERRKRNGRPRMPPFDY